MKKTAALLFGTFMLLSFSKLSAQDVFEKGDNVIQATIGFPQLLGYGSLYKTTIPAVAFVYDHSIVDGLIHGKASIGIGGLLGIAGSKSEYLGNNTAYGYKYTYILVGARGTFHYQFVDDLDTYAGILVGGYAANSTYYGANGYENYTAAEGGGLLDGAFVGVRYYFTDNFAVASELGFGIAIVNVGVDFKF